MATLLHALNDQGQWVPVNLSDLNEVGVTNEVEVKNASGEPIPVSHGLKIPEHDYVGMSYTGANMTQAIYKLGGPNGTTVATVSMGYDGNGNLTSVTVS